ncbi:hypothetical protein, partial [Methylobacterium variabile]|uniref:hypothetical protein n=1 Tax=Methylobacterium variabile TaxID=298794 RepID=UPI001AE01EF7
TVSSCCALATDHHRIQSPVELLRLQSIIQLQQLELCAYQINPAQAFYPPLIRRGRHDAEHPGRWSCPDHDI